MLNIVFRRKAYYLGSILYIVLGIVYFIVAFRHPYIGLNVQNVNGQWIVIASDPSGEGYLSGIRVGDIISKIDGDKISNFSNIKKWGQVEGACSLEFRKHDQIVKNFVKFPDRTNWYSNLQEIPLGILSFIFWILGFMTWYKRPFLTQARAIFWLNLIIALALVFAPASSRSLFYARELEYITFSLVPIFFINLISVFPKKNKFGINRICYLIFLITFGVITILTILQSLEVVNNIILLRKIVLVNVIGALLFALGGLSLLIKLPRENPERNQAGIVFLSVVIGFVPFVLLTAIPQVLDFQPIKYYLFSTLFLSVVPITWYYVIIKKYLPDSRVLFESILTMFFVAVIVSFILSFALYVFKIVTAINFEVYLVSLIITMLFMICINTIRFMIRKLFEKLLLFERKQGFKESILKLNENLPSMNEEDYILREVVTNLNIQGAYIIIENPKRGYLTKALGTFLENLSQQAELEEFFQGSQKANLKAIILPENLPAEIFIPVNSGDFSCGIFLGHRHSHIKFAEDELPLITLIASQLAQRLITSFVLKELSVEIKSLAQRTQDSQLRNQGLQGITNTLFKNLEQERARVAADIYDGPLQLGLDLNRWLKYLLEEYMMEDKIKNAVSHMRDLVENLNFELRQISNDLSPTALKDLGLLTAVELLCEEIMLKELALIALNTVSLSREDRFPAEIELTAYRLLQEGIFNAVKHSGANKLTISIEKTEANLELTVKDKGKGFDADKIGEWSLTGIHFGIIGMKERIESLGGSLQITSQIHRGTVLKATLPII